MFACPAAVRLAVAVLVFGIAATSQAAEIDPAAVASTTPDQIKWRNPMGVGPNNSANLHGDPAKPGFYVNLTKWNKGGNFSRPHSHPNDRFITVLSGTWWMGTGTSFDPDHSVPLPNGTFVTHFANQVHWDGAKDEDAVLLIVGHGPATTNPAQETQGRLNGIDPMAVVYKKPDQFSWRDPTDTTPTNRTILQGDPGKAGLYININRFKPGAFSRPHFHPNDRFIMVLKGTWWVGTGTKFDPNDTAPMPAGTFVTHFGRQVHFDGAKDEEVTLLIAGEGPATSTPAGQN